MRGLLLGCAAGAVALLGVGAGYVLYVHHQGRDVRGSASVEFHAPSTSPAPPRPARQTNESVAWPT